MKRLGEHDDNYTFLDIAGFKTRAKGRKSSRAARRICKTLARADKRSERQRALKEE